VRNIWELESPAAKSLHHDSSEPAVIFDLRVTANQSHVPLKSFGDSCLYSLVVTDWLAMGGDGFGPILSDYVDIQHTNTTLQSALLYFSKLQPTIRNERRSQNADASSKAGPLISLAAFVGYAIATICAYPLYSMSVLRATSKNRMKKSICQLYDGVFLATFAGALSNSLFYLFYHILSAESPATRAIVGSVMK